MYRKSLHYIMLLPILAATWLSFSNEPVATLSPEQVVSWTELSAALETPAGQGDSTAAAEGVSEGDNIQG